MSLANTRVQEPLLKKKKTDQPTSNPSLPDDLVVSCLARVSRLYYPTLSLASKSFRSLLVSPELYKIRSLLNIRDSCLYVCLQYPSEHNPRWFTLCRKPDINRNTSRKKKESSGNALAPLSFLNSPPVEWSNLIAVGHNLYAIPEGMRGAPCSDISFLDCRTHTWLEAPSLRLANTTLTEGRLYLAGNYEDPESLNCIEVYNTKTQTWKPVPPEKQMKKYLDLEGKICAICDRKGFALWPKERTWERVGLDYVCMGSIKCRYYKEFRWTTLASDIWRKIKGLECWIKLQH